MHPQVVNLGLCGNKTAGLDFLAAQSRRLFISTILLVIVVLLLLGALPRWPHSRNWGYGPSGLLGVVLVVVLLLTLLDRAPI